MNLTPDQLTEVEQMAELFMSADEIAVNIEVDTEEFEISIKIQSGEIYQAYMKGILKTKIALRKAILSSAINGSSPAQQMMKEFENKSKI